MNTVIIDVRSEKEFSEDSYPGAINLPANTFSISDYAAFRHDHIALVCFSGHRASSVKRMLEAEGLQAVSLLQHQMVDLIEPPRKSKNIWTVDRQFRFILGLFTGIFLLGYFWVSPLFILIPIILCLGLTITSIIDRCYLREGIALLPWNRRKSSPSRKLIGGLATNGFSAH